MSSMKQIGNFLSRDKANLVSAKWVLKVQATLILLMISCTFNLVLANENLDKEKLFKEEDGNFALSAEVMATESFVRLKHLTDHVFSKAEYKEILICKKPLKDKPLTLTREYLTSLFKSNGMDDKTLFLMDIPKEVKISCGDASAESIYGTVAGVSKAKVDPLTEIDCSEILLRVSNAIDIQLRKYDPQISIYQASGNSNWKVKVPEDYDLKVLPGTIIRSNSVTAKIGVYHKNVMVDSKIFNFRADIYIKSFAAETNLDKGHIIKKGDFTFQLIPYSVDALSFIRDEKLIVGFELQKNIKAGDGVESSDINTPVLVNRGASVNIVIKDEGFSIRATGIAQEAGRMGEQVPVLMRNSDVKVRCTVTGENTVDIIK